MKGGGQGSGTGSTEPAAGVSLYQRWTHSVQLHPGPPRVDAMAGVGNDAMARVIVRGGLCHGKGWK